MVRLTGTVARQPLESMILSHTHRTTTRQDVGDLVGRIDDSDQPERAASGHAFPQ
jgi:hypothetical protein